MLTKVTPTVLAICKQKDFGGATPYKAQKLHSLATLFSPADSKSTPSTDIPKPRPASLRRLITRLPSMSHESVWNSRPRSYGKGAREWYELHNPWWKRDVEELNRGQRGG